MSLTVAFLILGRLITVLIDFETVTLQSKFGS